MEIFITNIPPTCSQKRLKEVLEHTWQSQGLKEAEVSCWKARVGSSKIGKLVVHDRVVGQKILTAFGVMSTRRLLVSNTPLTLQLSRNLPDPYLIESLRMANEKYRIYGDELDELDDLVITSMECGVWEEDMFVSFYQRVKSGNLQIYGNSLQAMYVDRSVRNIFSSRLGMREEAIIFSQANIRSIVRDDKSYYISLNFPPKIYSQQELTGLEATTKWERMPFSHFDEKYRDCVASCFVYKFVLVAGQIKLPGVSNMRTRNKIGDYSIDEHVVSLSALLEHYDYQVAFQLHALAANGYLLPKKIMVLIPEVNQMIRKFGNKKTALLLQQFCIMSPQDAHDDPASWSDEALLELLRSMQLPKRINDAELLPIFAVQITPTGMFMSGPNFEQTNRVLRKYHNHSNHFLRVSVAEEDLNDFMFERDVSYRLLFKLRFEPIFMKQGLVIGGRSFSFLGFSQSSLRSRSCWFMTPFQNLTPQALINNIGDFSMIRIPARYAARVGQAFSSTRDSVEIAPENEYFANDIINGSRNFSDGVGMISEELRQRICDKGWNATVFQIRFAGAKGVVALNSELPGEMLCLRQSMIKFEGSTDRNLEVCSAAEKRLPFYLNRPLIKILEDLNVSSQTFMQLQNDALNQLELATLNAMEASHFMRVQKVGIIAHIPSIIMYLDKLGSTFRNDAFLSRIFELSLLNALRDIKYRMRIEVPRGATLIGVLDETNYLQEGEIYCAVEGLLGPVMITRSPAMHPGDVQRALSVDVPDDSPLKLLTNCVVFSQRGRRDLPSMLGGGDLDGDLYNVSNDNRLLPIQAEPADYNTEPPKTVGMVTLSDIGKFFLDFILNDRLGQISIAHMVIADQSIHGVFDPQCLQLAKMASIAVDFPKTGHAVKMNEMPRVSSTKPDFLAPGPGVTIGTQIELERSETGDGLVGSNKTRYYESKKILGQLYRAVDEVHFIKKLSHPHDNTAITKVRSFVKHYSNNTTFDSFAEDLKNEYVTTVGVSMADKLEAEVFIGCIVGRDRPTKKQREASQNLQEQYNQLLSFTVKSINGTDDTGNCLDRAAACLKIKSCPSFSWIAAGIALKEIKRIQMSQGQT